jgi:hypothetical protein
MNKKLKKVTYKHRKKQKKTKAKLKELKAKVTEKIPEQKTE